MPEQICYFAKVSSTKPRPHKNGIANVFQQL